MLHAGIDRIYRDRLLGHTLEGKDKYYLVIDERTLTKAMNKYTAWLDDQYSQLLNVDQNVG